jgi:hypothetical protein
MFNGDRNSTAEPGTHEKSAPGKVMTTLPLDCNAADGVKEMVMATPDAPLATLLNITMVSYAETIAGYVPSPLDATTAPNASVNAEATFARSACAFDGLIMDASVNTMGEPLENTPEENETDRTPLDEVATAFAPDGGETNVAARPDDGDSNVYM